MNKDLGAHVGLRHFLIGTQAKHTDEDLLPPLDLAPKPPALPPELWVLSEVETRTHRPAWQPPPRKPVVERRPPVTVPRWLAVAAVLCALYGAVRHNGYAIDCGRIDDAVQCRVVAQPAPWRKPS